MSLKHAKFTEMVPIAEFKSKAGPLLDRMKQTGEPIMLTKNGRAAGVIISPEEYEQIQYTQTFKAAVERGLSDANTGRVMNDDELVKRVSARIELEKKKRTR
jgi:prevent-host-death family protein